MEEMKIKDITTFIRKEMNKHGITSCWMNSDKRKKAVYGRQWKYDITYSSVGDGLLQDFIDVVCKKTGMRGKFYRNHRYQYVVFV